MSGVAMSPERWEQLMNSLNAPASLDVYAKLVKAYSEPHRHYHTAMHIQDCLDQLDQARSLAESPEEVELALWFHDAIYKPISSKNELESAVWARSFLEENDVSQDQCARVYSYIIATTHDAYVPEGDAALIVDIDLSSLGQTSEKYDQFERNVRKE